MKNKDILLDVIGDTDETLIPDLTADKKKSSIFKRAALGAVCAAAVIAGMIIIPKIKQNDNLPSPYDSLPQTDYNGINSNKTMIKSGIIFGDMGFEGMMAYDISELDTPNPWNSDFLLSSLPVYRNLSYNNLRIAAYLSEEKMQEIAQNTAAALKTDIKETKKTYVKDLVKGKVKASEEVLNSVFSLIAGCSDKTTITVYGDGKIRVDFRQQTLPSDYHFSHKDTSAEQAQQVLAYLSDKYADLLGFENAVCYSVAHRSYSGDEIRSYYIYNKSNDAAQDILNFSLSYSSFAPDDNGNLMCIWLNNPFCAAEYLGDYPIISEQDATVLLLDGNYYSTVPNEYIRNGVIASDDIAKTELVYHNGRDEYYQPYYKYYIELDTSSENMADGLKSYGIFYVPAILSGYLDDFSPNVQFN